MEPRKRKRLLLALASVALLLVILLLLSLGEREPTYEGRRLSEWIEIYAGTGPPSERQQAGVAIQAIGTNALPYLLEWIAHEPAPWRYQLGRLAELLPERLTGGSPLVRLTIWSHGVMRARAAMYAFEVLGPIAEPVLPELEQLLQRTNSPSGPERALFALAGVGPAAVPIMTNALAQPHRIDRLWVMVCIDHMGTNAWAFTPLIASQLTHTNDLIAKKTAHSFTMLGPTNNFDPELLVPVLIQFLQDPRSSVRRRAVFPLQTFRPVAAFLPALTNMLDDPDPDIRDAAIAAIRMINPSPLPEELRTPASPP